eukprot:5185009-Pleurochrysis_carterae.AAC.2
MLSPGLRPVSVHGRWRHAVGSARKCCARPIEYANRPVARALRRPPGLIRAAARECPTQYEMDAEDEAWLAQLNGSAATPLDASRFEEMMDLLERVRGRVPAPILPNLSSLTPLSAFASFCVALASPHPSFRRRCSDVSARARAGVFQRAVQGERAGPCRAAARAAPPPLVLVARSIREPPLGEPRLCAA